MDHPLYRSDLTPSNFFLLPEIKNKLRDQRFSTLKEAIDEFKSHVLEISQSECKKCFERFKCFRKCVNLHGEYFEKQ